MGPAERRARWWPLAALIAAMWVPVAYAQDTIGAGGPATATPTAPEGAPPTDTPPPPPDRQLPSPPPPPPAQVQTPASGDQIIAFDVAVPSGVAYKRIWIELQRLGEARTVALSDDGSIPADIAWDGIFVGRDRGGYARYVNVRMMARDWQGSERALYAGVIRTEDEAQAHMSFRVMDLPEGPEAMRVPAAYPGNISDAQEGLPLVVAFGWGMLVLTWVGLLVRRREAGR